MNSSIEKQQKGRHIRYVRNNRLDNKITFLLCTEKKSIKKKRIRTKEVLEFIMTKFLSVHRSMYKHSKKLMYLLKTKRSQAINPPLFVS